MNLIIVLLVLLIAAVISIYIVRQLPLHLPRGST
jgi:hypothetical protein